MIKYICAVILTIILLPMLVIWLMLDICLGEENTKEFLKDIWFNKIT